MLVPLGEECCHIVVLYRILATCLILHLMMHQMFSVDERSELQAGQSSTWSPQLQSHAIVIYLVCGLVFSGLRA